MRTLLLAPIFVLLFSASAGAEDSTTTSARPWRAGVGLQAGLGPLGGNFTLNPGLALITEYCGGDGSLCISATAAFVAATGQVNFGNVVVQNDGFDADISLGGRFVLVPGTSELSGFGVVQLGLSDPNNTLLTEIGLFFGMAFEQRVWEEVYLRLSSSLVGVQSVFQNNASAFALQVTLNPAAAVVVHF